MARLDEMIHRGRVVRGPLADLIELDDGAGGRRVAICHHESVRHDPALAEGLNSVRDFLALPMVEGLAPLREQTRGVLAYVVPPALRTVRELIAVFAEEGGAGPRAALELVAKAGSILVSAAEAAVDRGLQSHGSLDPWRICVDPSGRVVVLGYGLPSFDGLAFQADERQVPRPDSLRYFPPERLDGEPEDVTSDLFALSLIAAELCTGVPVYDGADLLDQVSAGEAADRVATAPPPLPALLVPMLAPFADKRPRQRRSWVRQAEEAARRASGRTLAELVTEGAQYLSDVEEDLPAEVPMSDLLGPEPEDPRLPALREQVAAAAARRVSAPEEPTGLDRGVPEVAAALARLASARATLDAAEAALAARGVGPVSTVEAAEQALRDLEVLHAALVEAAAEASGAAGQAREAHAQAVAEKARQQARAVDAARAKVAAAATALDALGEDEEAETLLGTARAALRKAEGARDVGAAARQYERASQAADQVEQRIVRALAERAARAAQLARVAAALEAAAADGIDVSGLEVPPADTAELEGATAAVLAELASRTAAAVAARQAALEARRATLRALVEGLSDDPEDLPGVAALRAFALEAGAAETLEQLDASVERVRREVSAVEDARAVRRAQAAALADALRVRLASRVREAVEPAVALDDPRVAALVRELQASGARGEGASAEELDRLLVRVEATVEALEPMMAAIRAEREQRRAAELVVERDRIVAAVARVRAALAGRPEPELTSFGVVADTAEGRLGEGDPDTLRPIAAAVSAAADACEEVAERLAAEVRAAAERARTIEEQSAVVARALAQAEEVGVDTSGASVDAVAGAADPVAAALGQVALLTERTRVLLGERAARRTAARGLVVGLVEGALAESTDPAEEAQRETLRSHARTAGSEEDPQALEALAERARADIAALEEARGRRLAERAAREQELRAHLQQAVDGAVAPVAELFDPRLPPLVEALQALARQGAAAGLDELLRLRDEVAPAVLALEAQAAAVRQEQEAARLSALAHQRARVQSALGRVLAATAGREELALYVADAASASSSAAVEEDPDVVAALAQRAEAAAEVAEQLLAEILAEEEDVRRARLGGIAGRARKAEVRSHRFEPGPAVALEIAAALQRVLDAVEVAVAEEALAGLEERVRAAEHDHLARVAAEAEAREARAVERLARVAPDLARLEAAAATWSDPRLTALLADGRSWSSALAARPADDVGDALVARIAECAQRAAAFEAQLEAARLAAELAAEEARRAELDSLRAVGRTRSSAAPPVDEPEGEERRAALMRAVAELEAAEALPDAHAAVARVLALADALDTHVRGVAVQREAARIAALVAARAELSALVASAGEPTGFPAVVEAVTRLRARAAELLDDELHGARSDVAEEVAAIGALRARLEAEAAEVARAAAALAAGRERLQRATSRMDVHAESEDGDDPAVVAVLGEVLFLVADLSPDAPAETVDRVAAELERAADGLDEVRLRAAAARLEREREREARRSAVQELRTRAGQVSDRLVESTIRYDDPAVVELLTDTESALEAMSALDDDEAAARALLARVEANADRMLGTLAHLEALAEARARDEALRAARLVVTEAMAAVEPILRALEDPALSSAYTSLRERVAGAETPGEATELLDAVRDLEARARTVAAARVEDERRHREQARALAHAAMSAAQATTWLSRRSDLLDRLLAMRARIEQESAADALTTAQGMHGAVGELDQEARIDQVRAGQQSVRESVAHLVGELPVLSDDAPPELTASVQAIRVGATLLRDGELDLTDLDEAERELVAIGQAFATLERTAQEVAAGLAGWRSSRMAAAVDRARAASGRAFAAWREASAVRDDPTVRAAVDEAEQACALVAGTDDPGEADWNAALAVSAADRAEEGLATLQDELRAAIAALSALQPVRDDAENQLLSWGSAASAGPEAELHHTWSRAEAAARRASRREVEVLGGELRALADRIREGVAASRASTPAPVMSLAERIQQAQRSSPGQAIQVGPTLAPDASGAFPLGSDTAPTTRTRPPTAPAGTPPQLPTAITARPTLAPVDDPAPTGTPGSTGRRSVAELQARLRARAAQRTTPPSGTPAPASPAPSAPPRSPAPSAPPSPAPRPALPDLPTAPRPLPRPPGVASPKPAPKPASNHDADARTTLMTREDLERAFAAAMVEGEDEDEDGPPTTVFRPSDFGADEDEPPDET